LEDIEERNQHEFGSPAFGGERSIGDGEEQRCDHCRQHPQGRAQRIFGQVDRIERNDRLLELQERRQGLVGALCCKQQQPEDEWKSYDVPEVRDQTPRR